MVRIPRVFVPRSGEDVACFVLIASALFLGWRLGWGSGVWGNAVLFVAVLIAVVSLRASRRTERQKATLDFLRAYNDSEVVIRGAAILNGWKTGHEHSALDAGGKFAVNEFLNIFEFLAVGLKHGIYDEEMVRDAIETAIVRYYKRAELFIRDARLEKDDVLDVAFEHFENLARRLQKQMKTRAP